MSAPLLRRKLQCKNHNALREKRVGIMLHFDGSSSDEGAWRWFTHPDCKVSYNDLVLDDGSYVVVVPWDRRAWHAGECRPSEPRLKYSDANSAFYGISAATNERTPVTAAQRDTIVHLCREIFRANGWPLSETWRIVGHETEAWPRGRKIDPTGPNKARPILSVEEIRSLVAAS